MKDKSPETIFVPSSYSDKEERPSWEIQAKSNGGDLEDRLSHFWKKYKYHTLFAILAIQGLIYYWSIRQLNHPSIPPNEEGRVIHNTDRFVEAESRFIESASFDFNREKPLLNLGLNYHKAGDFEEAHRLMENVMASNRFFWPGYEADGRILFDWGKKELENPDCDIRQTEVLWTIAKKRFRYASLIAFIQIKDWKEGLALRKSEQEINQFLLDLPQWRENCLNPPPSDSNSDNSNNDSNNNNNSDDSKNSKGSGDPNDSNESPNDPNQQNPPKGNPPNGGESPSGPDDTDNKNDSQKNNNPPSGEKENPNSGDENNSEIDKKRASNQKERQEKRENLSWEDSDKDNLDEARKRLSRGAGNEDYVRHKDEINFVTSVKELEEAMKKASW